MVMCGVVARLSRSLSQMEGGRVSFAIKAKTECVYLKRTQGYIAQDKPTKSPQMILEKGPTNRIANGAN